MEKKMTENRIKHHEMVDFYQKVKTLYHSWTKKKADPTPSALYKWVNDRKIDLADQSVNSILSGTTKSFMSKSKLSRTRGKKPKPNNLPKVEENEKENSNY